MVNNGTVISSTNTKMNRYGKVFSSIIHAVMQDPGKISLHKLWKRLSEILTEMSGYGCYMNL